MEKLFLRETSVLDIAKQDGQEITETEVKQAIEKTRFSAGNALLLRTGWGDRGAHKRTRKPVYCGEP